MQLTIQKALDLLETAEEQEAHNNDQRVRLSLSKRPGLITTAGEHFSKIGNEYTNLVAGSLKLTRLINRLSEDISPRLEKLGITQLERQVESNRAVVTLIDEILMNALVDYNDPKPGFNKEKEQAADLAIDRVKALLEKNSKLDIKSLLPEIDLLGVAAVEHLQGMRDEFQEVVDGQDEEINKLRLNKKVKLSDETVQLAKELKLLKEDPVVNKAAQTEVTCYVALVIN